MKTLMTTLMIGVATASMAGPARAFDGAPALPPKAKALADAQEARTATKGTLDGATQTEVDAKAKVAELEKQKPADDASKKVHADELKEAKAAATAATKAQKAAKTADDRAVKAVTKAEGAAKTEAEKLAKEQAKAAEAAANTVEKQPTQNDITRPKPDTQTGKAWAIFDQISATNKAPASIGEALPQATAAGINEATVRTQYARWRKFNGVAGRVTAPTPPAPPAPPAAPTGDVPPAPPAPPVAA